MNALAHQLGGFLILLVIGAIFGLLGPYGTYYDLGVAERFTYWMIAIPVIGVPSSLAIGVMARTEPAASWPAWAQALTGALIAGIPSTLIAVVLDSIFRHAQPISALRLVQMYGSVTVVIALIGIPLSIIRARRAATARAPSGPAPATAPVAQASNGSPFLRRIPTRLGTDLLYIATEDHYLRVTTKLGSDLILFRLSDAVAELDRTIGQQVHRSYWVARRAVASVVRKGPRTCLILTDGTEVPVSRTFLPVLRDAGWLATPAASADPPTPMQGRAEA